MKMKLKKTLTAVSAAAVSAGAIAVLALAGQGLAFAQVAGPYPSGDDFSNGASDAAAFGADVNTLCTTASQPFANKSDPQIDCSNGGTTTTP